MKDIRILLVHPDPAAIALMTSMLQSLNVRLEHAESDRAAVRRLERDGIDVIVAGVDPDDPEAMELLHYVRRKFPKLPAVLLFSVGHAERTREARQLGASAVLRFPLPATQLRAAVAQALGCDESIVRSNSASGAQGHGGAAPAGAASSSTNGREAGDGWMLLEAAGDSGPGAGEAPGRDIPVLIGEDESLLQAIELTETIAPTRAPVLIQGEAGTGKRQVARALHHQSRRRRGPFVEVRCADGGGADLERELFGMWPLLGPPVPGKVAKASGGTIYIDDIAAMGPELQARLLRLLRDGDYEPIGHTRPERADVRLAFGTREDLAELVARGAFRQDLYYRISVVGLKLPPLRHRGTDVDRLAEHVRARAARRLDRPVGGFSAEALAQMRRYHWPENVRELEAAVERAVLLCRGRLIEPADLGLSAVASGDRGGSPACRPSAHIRPLKEALEEPEKQIILEALEALGWNRQETAKVLDINRTTLYKKMKKYGLLLDEPAWAN